VKTLSLIAGLAAFGNVGCKKEIPAPKASPAAATTNQGTIVSNGGFTWYLGSGFTKDWTNTTRDGTNWPAGEVKVTVKAIESPK
jgi:hypothetical protein